MSKLSKFSLRLKTKLLLLFFVVGIPLCLWTSLLTLTIGLGYQHDNDPEAFTRSLESLGVLEVTHFKIPPINLPLPPGDGTVVKGKISHYWPPLGGTNCGDFRNGRCVSRMASGEPWEKWVDVAVACPREYPFGTQFVIQGKTWVCMDRGGGIVAFFKDILGWLTKVVWLDQLTETATVPYGTEIDVQVYLPDDATPTPITPGVDIGVSSPLGYLVIGKQNIFQKAALAYMIFTGLVSDDLLAIDGSIDNPSLPPDDTPPPVANCDDPKTPCLFPIEGGLDSVVTGTSGNGGLGCHTSGGPATIKGWDYWEPDKSEGAILYAAMDGYVDWAGTDGLQNPVIQISNGQYLLTYMHMKQMFVHSGQKVTQGQSIGILGNVGNSDWAHLHFSIYEKGVGPICDQTQFFANGK